MTLIKSSSIQAYEYDSNNQLLTVWFKTGTKYEYKDIDPPTMSKVFDQGGSIGSKFQKVIAKNYNGTKTKE